MLAKSGLRGPAWGARRQAGRRLVYGESIAWGLLTVNSTGVVIIRTARRKTKEPRGTRRALRSQRKNVFWKEAISDERRTESKKVRIDAG